MKPTTSMRSSIPTNPGSYSGEIRGDDSPTPVVDVNVIRIPPYHYIHVLDRNSNVTRLEIGPQTFIRQDHEKFVTGSQPVKMITLPPR